MEQDRNRPDQYGDMYVYFARCGEYLKIGASMDPRSRLKQILKDGHRKPEGLDYSQPVKLIGVMRGVWQTERHFHEQLRQFCEPGTSEWYRWNESIAKYLAGRRIRYEERFDPSIQIGDAKPAKSPLPPLSVYPSAYDAMFPWRREPSIDRYMKNA